MKVDDSKYKEFVEAAHKVARYGLVQCSSGNLSWRIGSDQAVLSASGAWLAELTTDQIVLCELSSGTCLNDVRPTCEAGFHLGILRKRSDVNVVLHFQSPYATALACGHPERHDLNLTIEVPVYIGQASVVEYLPPGSSELAEAVVNALADHSTQMAILKNHGLVTVGKTFDDAIQKAVFFEQACHIRLVNRDARPLDFVAVSQLQDLGKA